MAGLSLALAVSAGTLATTVAAPRPLLVWNVSASAPIGLYLVSGVDGIGRGDLVIARLAEPYRSLAAARRYLPANLPLIKRVAATSGDVVCARGDVILVGGERVATRLRADAGGRAMPWWRGCVRLRDPQLLLLTSESPASFDGRYFGVSERDDVVGRARLLWPW